MLKNRFPIVEYFNHREFDSPDVLNSGLLMDIDFILLLNQARKTANIPFIISSGYRSKSHNNQVGGKKDSSHLKGLAVDIKCSDNIQRFIIIKALLNVGINRIGIGKGFIHADVDLDKKSNVIWLY